MERQSKTNREWFESWEEYGQLAIEEAENQVEDHTLDYKSDSLPEALSSGFIWDYTSQGHEFWQNLCDSILRKEYGY